MTRHAHWVGALSAAFCVFWGSLVSESAAAESTVAPAGDGPASTQACGVWIEPGNRLPGKGLSFHVRYAEEHAPGEAVSFECEIRSEEVLENATAWLGILDESDLVLHEGEIPLAVIPKGQSRCEFEWDAEGLRDGTYTARFELLSQHDRRLMAAHELGILAISAPKLESDIKSAGAQVAEAMEFIQTLDEMGIRPAYARMRTAVAHDSLGVCRKAYEEGDWRRAHKVAQYILDTVRSMRCRLILSELIPELMEPVPQPSFASVEVRDGAFTTGTRPVFLFGGFVGEDSAKDLGRTARYGLNLGVVDVSPEETLGGKEKRAGLKEELDDLFRRARREDVGIIARLCPPGMDDWVLRRFPELENTGFGRSQYDVTQPASRELLERHFKAVLPYLKDKDMLQGACILEKPQFHLGGEAVRQGFIAYVKGEYPDRYAVNRAWQSRMGDLQDIDIWWDYKKPAYQFDWQWYHIGLGTEFIAGLDSLANRLAPEVPLFLGFADDILEEGESSSGIDRQTLAETFPVTGCVAEHSAQDALFAMEYPGQILSYALLRSFAPDKPLINIENRFLVGHDRFTDYSYEYVHSLMWESAMAGLSASAIPMGEPGYRAESETDIWQYPQCVEGYAAACLDLNRLAPIVGAFQQAPVDVAILWSLPSKIFDDGVPHLASLKMAFEGLSWFGYKVGFITERQCVQGGLDKMEILVISETPAVSDRAFRAMAKHIDQGGVVIRVGNPMPYGPHREARQDMLPFTDGTIMMQTADLPTSFLHSMDTAFSLGVLEEIPRPINGFGFPLEGVKSQHLKHEGVEYLYIVNLRKEPVKVYLYGGAYSGRDLIHAQDVEFPTFMDPLTPMLVRLDPAPLVAAQDEETVASADLSGDGFLEDVVLSVELHPVSP